MVFHTPLPRASLRGDITLSTAALTSAAAAAPPPLFEDVEGFLVALSQWLQRAGARLSCHAQLTKLNYTLEVLTAYNSHAHAASTSLWIEMSAAASFLSTPDEYNTNAASTALLSMSLSVLGALIILVVLWYGIFRLLSCTVPGLRARRHASLIQEQLRCSQAVIARDARLGTTAGLLRRRTNQHQLISACVCTAAAAILIGMLLTLHVWTRAVLWEVWSSLTGPILKAWSWALMSDAQKVPDWLTGATTSLSLYVTGFLRVTHVPQFICYVPHLIWEATQQLQVLYLWHLVGSVILGVSLWLLQFAHHRMVTYNSGTPYVTSRSTEPQLLHKLREAEARRRRRVTHRLQLEAVRLNQLLLERVEEVRRGAAFPLLAGTTQQDAGSPLRLEDAGEVPPAALVNAATADNDDGNDAGAAFIPTALVPSAELRKITVNPTLLDAEGDEVKASLQSTPCSTDRRKAVSSTPLSQTGPEKVARFGEENGGAAEQRREVTTDEAASV